MPKIKVDFWNVLDADGEHFDLMPACKSCGAKPPQQRMNDVGSEYVDYLAEADCDVLRSFGTIARIRKRNWPERVNLKTGALQPLALLQDEALAEEINFLYDKKLRVLVTQKHRFFRPSALVDLISNVEGVTFAIHPILRKDAWNRFRKMTRIGSLEVKLTSSLHHPDFSDAIPAMGTLLDEAADKLNAVDVGLHLYVGHHRKKELDLGLIRRMIGKLRDAQSVKSLAVRGSDTDGEPSAVVDFIRDRLVFSGEVGYSENHLERKQCQRLLRDAIAQNSSYLKTLL